MVILMISSIRLFYGGFVRRKNVVSIVSLVNSRGSKVFVSALKNVDTSSFYMLIIKIRTEIDRVSPLF